MAHRDTNYRGPAEMKSVGPSDISMDTHPRKLLRALRLRRGDRGQAIIEFAMVLPLLCAVVLIFVSFGKAVYYYIQYTHAANEGAREAVVNLPSSTTALPGGATTLASYLQNQIGDTGATVDICYSDATPPSGHTNRSVGEPVTVKVSKDYSWFPFMNLGTFKIVGSSTMRIEQDTSGNTKLDPTITTANCKP